MDSALNSDSSSIEESEGETDKQLDLATLQPEKPLASFFEQLTKFGKEETSIPVLTGGAFKAVLAKVSETDNKQAKSLQDSYNSSTEDLMSFISSGIKNVIEEEKDLEPSHANDYSLFSSDPFSATFGRPSINQENGWV